MSEPFVLGGLDGPRWLVHPPQDPYGDGYVHTVATELRDGAMSAATVARIDGTVQGPGRAGPGGFVRGLAEDFAGWPDARRWWSLERELELDARHDGRGYVSLGVTLRAARPAHRTGWSARTVFVLEAGEELSRAAAGLVHLLDG